MYIQNKYIYIYIIYYMLVIYRWTKLISLQADFKLSLLEPHKTWISSQAYLSWNKLELGSWDIKLELTELVCHVVCLVDICKHQNRQTLLIVPSKAIEVDRKSKKHVVVCNHYLWLDNWQHQMRTFLLLMYRTFIMLDQWALPTCHASIENLCYLCSQKALLAGLFGSLKTTLVK